MGPLFGIAVAVLASVTLIMAVNTAMVASSELIEKVVEKYGFHWLIKLNKRQSYYRIHILNALFYSIILTITSGSQAVLAEMYAVGLVASFCINIFSILVYRYSKGTKGNYLSHLTIWYSYSVCNFAKYFHLYNYPKTLWNFIMVYFRSCVRYWRIKNCKKKISGDCS